MDATGPSVPTANALREPNKRNSALFCDPTADIVFESSDEVVFKLHSKHILSTSHGLASGILEHAKMDPDPAQLSESSEILEILFQFIEPPPDSRNLRYPSLVDLEATLFFNLAEAAEKYVVFAAMGMCITRMHFMSSSHPLDTLNHSFKHGYEDLQAKCIMSTLSNCDLEEVANKLTAPGLLVKWLKYVEKWRQVANAGERWYATTSHEWECGKLYAKWNAYSRQCADSPGLAGSPMRKYGAAPSRVTSLKCNTVYGVCGCSNDEPLETILARKVSEMPSFSSI